MSWALPHGVAASVEYPFLEDPGISGVRLRPEALGECLLGACCVPGPGLESATFLVLQADDGWITEALNGGCLGWGLGFLSPGFLGLIQLPRGAKFLSDCFCAKRISAYVRNIAIHLLPLRPCRAALRAVRLPPGCWPRLFQVDSSGQGLVLVKGLTGETCMKATAYRSADSVRATISRC